MDLWSLSLCRIKIAQACLALCLQLLGEWGGLLVACPAHQYTTCSEDLGFMLESHTLVWYTMVVLGAHTFQECSVGPG